MATFEEASYCPKCSQKGKVVLTKPGRRGSKIHVIHCQNQVCPWFESGWTVQVQSDGSVYERQPGPKEFTKLTNTDRAIAERLIQEVRDGI